MESSRAHIILPTNAANSLAGTTPTAIVRDTVIQTNREGEPPEYREIITTEKILQPTLLESVSPPNISTGSKTITTTTVVEEVPVPADYVITTAGAFKPVTVVFDSTLANSATNRIVKTTVTEPVTTKVTKTTETIETTK
jgi:hypothetical protein